MTARTGTRLSYDHDSCRQLLEAFTAAGAHYRRAGPLRPPRSGAGAWNIALGRTGENEIIVSPDRVELSNQRLQLGDSMCLHVSGEVNYPRYLPHPDWTDQFSFLPSRVCVKAGW